MALSEVPPPGFFDDAEPRPYVNGTANGAGDTERVPPHDLDAEAAVLSAVLLDPSAFDKVKLRLAPRDFFAERHRLIYEASASLAAKGLPIDVVQIAGELRDRERLAQVGGMAYLTEVLNAAPAVTNVASYAERVLEKARVRRTIAAGQRIAAFGYSGADALTIVEDAIADLSALRPANTRSETTISLVERARQIRERGPVIRLPTGLRTLDENCRGGLRLGTVVVFGGAPGVGKTALAVDLAHRWARTGIVVDMLASDEGPDDVLMRLAMHEGFDPARLENADSGEWDEFERRLADLPLHLFDGDDGVTLEDVAAHLAHVADGKPSVVIGDSVQTIVPSGMPAGTEARLRVDLVVKTAKRIARSGPLVVLTSELGRNAYKNRTNAENASALASFKESGGIEYGVQTALVLRSVPGGDGRVEVEIPKNRGGRKTIFFLEVDARTRVLEVDAPTEPDNETVRDRNVANVERDALELLRVVASHPGIGERGLRAKVAAAGIKLGVTRFDAARERLLVSGRIENRFVQRGDRTDAHYHAVAVGGEGGEA